MTGYAVFGDPETGIWHDECASHALVRWPVYLLTARGVTSGAEAERCLTCQPHTHDPDEDD